MEFQPQGNGSSPLCNKIFHNQNKWAFLHPSVGPTNRKYLHWASSGCMDSMVQVWFLLLPANRSGRKFVVVQEKTEEIAILSICRSWSYGSTGMFYSNLYMLTKKLVSVVLALWQKPSCLLIITIYNKNNSVDSYDCYVQVTVTGSEWNQIFLRC